MTEWKKLSTVQAETGLHKSAVYPAKHSAKSLYGMVCVEQGGVFWLITRYRGFHTKDLKTKVHIEGWPRTKLGDILILSSAVDSQLQKEP